MRASSCRPCHPKQFDGQSLSGHARTLHAAPLHPLAGRFASAGTLKRSPNFSFVFSRATGGLQMGVGDGNSEIDIPIDWAFGSGTHGVTFVSRLGTSLYLEHAFSFYPAAGVFDLTPGHRGLPTRSMMEAAGQSFRLRNEGDAIWKCFRCHSTGPMTISSRQEIGIAEPGVRCEVCHGPGKAHLAAPSRRPSIRNPREMPVEEQLRLCGGCHRPPDGSEASNDFTNPWNVRHQPPYLEKSKCFREGESGLSCFTCHAPHEPLRRTSPAYYRSKCLACHTAMKAPPVNVCLAESEPDCIRCHMPLVQPEPRLIFRNHWIGVFREGAPLIPVR